MSQHPIKKGYEEERRSIAYAPGRPTYAPWRKHFVWPWKPLRLQSRNSAGQVVERVKYFGFVWARIAMMPNPHLQFSIDNPEKNAPKAILKAKR